MIGPKYFKKSKLTFLPSLSAFVVYMDYWAVSGVRDFNLAYMRQCCTVICHGISIAWVHGIVDAVASGQSDREQGSGEMRC